MDISRWLLKNLKVLRGIYRAWYVLWQSVIASIALMWITMVGFLLCKLPPLTTLPRMLPVYLTVGLGLILLVLSMIGLVVCLAVLSEKWWKWTKRSIFKKVRNRIWDLEYNVQEANQKAFRLEAINLEKLKELKNASWQV